MMHYLMHIVHDVTYQLVDITTYLSMGHVQYEWTVVQRKQLVTRVVDYQLIARQFYKLGVDGVM